MARLVGGLGVEDGRREVARWSGRKGKYPLHCYRTSTTGSCHFHQSDSGSNSIVDAIKEGYKRTNEYTTSRLKEKKNTQTQKRNLEEQKHGKHVGVRTNRHPFTIWTSSGGKKQQWQFDRTNEREHLPHKPTWLTSFILRPSIHPLPAESPS